MTDSDDFASATSQFRGELLAHCYRMLGSIEEAEDLVQDTYLRAWRSYDGFAGRSSVRTWLYRIATNACLTAIEQRGRRPLPSGLGDPVSEMEAAPVARTDIPWLQPFPDARAAGEFADPATVVWTRAGIRLALIAALQYLSARQRAMVILRDVLEWPAADVADLLGMTTTAVNSGLRRARAELARVLPVEEDLAEPAEADRRALVERFAAAIEGADAAALSVLLRDDVELEMPPLTSWFAGRTDVLRCIDDHFLIEPGGLRLVPISANDQPAFAVYQRGGDGAYHAHALMVLSVSGTEVTRIVSFVTPDLFKLFGLPASDGIGAEAAAPPWQR